MITIQTIFNFWQSNIRSLENTPFSSANKPGAMLARKLNTAAHAHKPIRLCSANGDLTFDPNKISAALANFLTSLYSKNSPFPLDQADDFFRDLCLPSLSSTACTAPQCWNHQNGGGPGHQRHPTLKGSGSGWIHWAILPQIFLTSAPPLDYLLQLYETGSATLPRLITGTYLNDSQNHLKRPMNPKPSTQFLCWMRMWNFWERSYVPSLTCICAPWFIEIWSALCLVVRQGTMSRRLSTWSPSCYNAKFQDSSFCSIYIQLCSKVCIPWQKLWNFGIYFENTVWLIMPKNCLLFKDSDHMKTFIIT